MKFLKLSLVIVGLVVLAFVASRFYHFNYTVNTWDDWCSQILEEDLYAFAIRFDDAAIRADFVQKYNDFIVEKIADKYLGGAKLTDKVVQEMARLKMIGVWNEGDNLYLKNGFLIIDNELGIDEFSEWENQFRKYLDIRQNRQNMDDFQYCIYGTINTHFKNFILIGPNDKSVAIPLEFTRKEGFK